MHEQKVCHHSTTLLHACLMPPLRCCRRSPPPTLPLQPPGRPHPASCRPAPAADGCYPPHPCRTPLPAPTAGAPWGRVGASVSLLNEEAGGGCKARCLQGQPLEDGACCSCDYKSGSCPHRPHLYLLYLLYTEPSKAMTTRGGGALPVPVPPVPAAWPSRLSTPAMAAAVSRALRMHTKRQTSWTCWGMGMEG